MKRFFSLAATFAANVIFSMLQGPALAATSSPLMRVPGEPLTTSSRGKRGSNAAIKRAAIKRRGVARHRAHITRSGKCS
jgi:hypothetical protein